MKKLLQTFGIGLLFSSALALVIFTLVHLGAGFMLAVDSYASGELGAGWAAAMAAAMCVWTAPKLYAASRAVQLALTWKPTA